MAKPHLKLPPPNGDGNSQAIECPGNALIFGANGSGKSRLGAWIELRSGGPDFVHRISAQRALTIPDFAPVKTLEESLNDFFWGHTDPRFANAQHKSGHRWGSHPDTHLLNDYAKVLSALFASDSKRNKDYVEKARISLTQSSAETPPIPESELDVAQEVWRDIMPHRRIELVDGQIKAFDTDGGPYKGGEMSDGEKVALYLLSQCLLIKDGSTVIIDEPELHLHRSLMSRLWSTVERLRPDCLFVYITHDLDFAASRVDAKKIWVKSYLGQDKWSWGFAESLPDIPDAILLEVLGSRKAIVFVEGDRGSLDTAILQAVYPEHHIIARGGCASVIQSTKALRLPIDGMPQGVLGIIDRDFRTDAEIAALVSHGIHVLPVAEIENLLCREEILRIVISKLSLPLDETLTRIRAEVLSWLRNEFNVQVASRTGAELKFQLSLLETSTRSSSDLSTELSDFISSISVSNLWSESERQLQRILDQASYPDCLCFYNRKSLPRRIAPLLGLQANAYSEMVLNILRSEEREAIVAAFRSICPTLPA
jgi:hypothetical protein